MAGEEVRVNPHAVGEISRFAKNLQDGLANIATSARNAVSPGAAAWGDDDFGAKFADGDKGFVSGSDNISTGTENLSTSFGHLTNGLRGGGGSLTTTEHANTDGFKNV